MCQLCNCWLIPCSDVNKLIIINDNYYYGFINFFHRNETL